MKHTVSLNHLLDVTLETVASDECAATLLNYKDFIQVLVVVA